MRNFIIVGTPRTGSSALAQIIGFHPKVACGWQWTARIPWWKKIKAAQCGLRGDFTRLPEDNRAHMQSICEENTQWLGFRALFRSSDKWLLHPRLCPPLWIDRLEQHIRWIASKPDIAVNHITRADNLAWLKSYIFSRVTNIYVGRPYPEGLTVKIGEREALARVRSKQWLDSRLAQLKKTNPYLRVEYESLCEDKQGTGEAVIRLLGCDLSDYHVDEDMMDQKQAKGSTREGIENYDELADALGFMRAR